MQPRLCGLHAATRKKGWRVGTSPTEKLETWHPKWSMNKGWLFHDVVLPPALHSLAKLARGGGDATKTVQRDSSHRQNDQKQNQQGFTHSARKWQNDRQWIRRGCDQIRGVAEWSEAELERFHPQCSQVAEWSAMKSEGWQNDQKQN